MLDLERKFKEMDKKKMAFEEKYKKLGSTIKA